MNRFNNYDMTAISLEKVESLIDEYLNQVNNPYLKKVAVQINNNDLEVKIEPYYEDSDKWETLINLLKVKKVNFWFRDDDAGVDNCSLIHLIEFMNNLNINILIAAIPKETDDNLAIKLKKYSNIRIGQHGYSHNNYSKEEQSEYPENRNEELVKSEIIRGRDKLKDLFGNKFINVFIPPWFEIDKKFQKIIKRENFVAMSNYWGNHINEFNLIEANCQVDLVDWDIAYTFGGEEFVLNQIINELENDSSNIGILLHHERMGEESYSFLNKLITILNKYANITSIEEVIKSLGGEND